MNDEDVDELKSQIAIARKRDLNFALCLGKKPEGTVLLTHKIKNAEILRKQAKKAGETAKIAFGIMRVKSKDVMFTCEDKPPSGIARKSKEFFKTIGLQMKVKILDPSGQILEDDGDADEDGQQQISEAQDIDPNAARWVTAEKSFVPQVKEALRNPAADASKIRSMWAYAQETAREGGYASALKVLTRLKPLLDIPSESPAKASPDAKKWAVLEPQVGKLFKQAMAGNPQNRTQLESAWAMAHEKAEADEATAAIKILDRLVPALKKAIDDAGKNGASGVDVPKDVVPFQKARILWSTTKDKMRKEISKLENAIVEVLKKDGQLAKSADTVRGLSKRLDVFDDRLEDTLDKITGTAEGAERTALKKQAIQQISEYSAALGSNFFKEVDTDNGFADVAVAAAARQSLSKIEKTLQ